MKDLLEKKLFPHVIKPGRYTGGEIGQIVKNPEGKTKYLHAFPDKYELGQAYMGLQTLYHNVNKDERFLCERAYAVDIDAEEIMRRENIPLFSLESYRAAKDFDAIGFTVPFELLFTSLLSMIDLAQIPILAAERTDDHPIIMAGGPSVYNPEPLADFIDLFFIGDGEEGLPEILDVLHQMRGESRRAKLEAIVRKVKSVYVPAFYDSGHKPTVDFAPETIEARVEPSLKPEYYPEQPIIPLIDIVHNYLAVEIMRGCPQACRFCMAGPIYRPVRTRDQNEIIRQTETQLGNTGYDEVTLLSLSTSDYPDIASLATKLAKRLAPKRISVALPSLRPGTISPQLLDAVSKVRKAGLTLAPEAGTERLRLFIRKDFCDEAIYDTVRLAFEKGWTTLKLYFMIGLPTETEKDLLGIIDVIRRVYEIGRNTNGRKTINITLSPFAPKPHTPFQWDEVCSPEVIERKIVFLRHHNHIRNVHIKYTSTETNMLQAVLGRGGREMGRVILAAYNKGCRFDGWTDHFNFSKWAEAFTECGIELADHLKPIPFSNPLPWGHITKGPSAERLQNERQRTSATLKDYTPWLAGDDKPGEPETPAMSFGRATKKAPTRAVVAPTKSRVRLMWGKTARYKYMSHLDNLRTLERAIRRSDMPIAYSQGFNPSMKLSFGPPLPLGFTSEAELVDITLDTNIMPYMIDNLKLALPDGIYIVDSRVVFTKAKSISSLLNRVIYTVPFKEKWNESDLNDKVTALLDSQTLEIERVGKSGTKVVDIRPGIYDLKVENDLLVMTMGVGDGGYVRPSELLRLLTEDDDDAYLAYMVHRKEMYRVDENGEKIHPMDL